MINKLFVENLIESLPKTEPIPLTQNAQEKISVDFDKFSDFINISPDKPKKFTNFNRAHSERGMFQFGERRDVRELCESSWAECFEDSKETDPEGYLRTMAANSFTLCVHGSGVDVNPKFSDALIVGTIPIIRRNEPYTTIYSSRSYLPVVIVESWEPGTITPQKLEEWHQEHYHKFTDNRDQILEFLSMDYWVRKVREGV